MAAGTTGRGVTAAGASPSDPARWLDGAAIERSAVLFVIGRGDGGLRTALARRGWRGKVVALEPSGTSTLAPSPDLTVLTGPGYAGLDDVVRALEPDCEQPVIVGDPALLATRREDVAQATRLVMKAWFGARANQEARRKFAGPYLLNTLRNRGALAAGGDAAVLAGLTPGVPVVVVAAGPSLDRVLPEIAAVRDRALVVAVDTAARPLLGAGITPDLIVALDPSEVNATHLADLPACPDTPLVAEGSLDPHALASFHGRTLFFRVADHHPWPWLRSLGHDRHLLRAWGSVLTTAFDLALTMGADPIAFVGADLAFTDGRPYARGTTFEEEWRRAIAWGHSLTSSWAQRVSAWPEMLEPGVDGTPARTAPHLRAFRDWIATEAGRAAGRTVVNATGAGVLVGDAIRQQTLAEALAGAAPLAPEVRARLVALGRGQGAADAAALPAPAPDVVQTWMAFGGVSAEAIGAACDAPTVVVEPMRLQAAPPALPAPPPPGADALYLAELSRSSSVRLLTMRSPGQDLLADLRRHTADLGDHEAVVVVDDLDLGMGLPVRRAIDALLCERPDLWLDYRRFVDYESRLAVLRGGAGARLRPAAEADADKWDPAHQETARRLAPYVVREFAPASVVDVGCGAGYWLESMRALGVDDVLGISARSTALDRWTPPARRFDVCLCLEIAPRLSAPAQDAVIAACTQLSDVVVFSARLPGAPDGSPHDRPLPYWAERFWRHGYVVEDGLRRAIELHTPVPASIYDVMLVFRRRVTPAREGEDTSEVHQVLGAVALDIAERLHDVYTQKIWWAVAALAREPAKSPNVELPEPQLVSWVIPSGRLAPAADGARVLRLRTETGRWYVTHPAAALRVDEDGQPLTEVPFSAFSPTTRGAWTRWRDEILIRAADGSDPRVNQRVYTLVVPAHVAWAESRPLAETLACDL